MSKEENKVETSDSSEDSLSLELVVEKTDEDEKKPEIATDRNIYDFDLETMKDKPWLKPGANMTDYFNYGFTEQTWKKYCEMQKQTREWVSKQTRHNDGRQEKDGKWHNQGDYERRRRDNGRRKNDDERRKKDDERRGKDDERRGNDDERRGKDDVRRGKDDVRRGKDDGRRRKDDSWENDDKKRRYENDNYRRTRRNYKS